MNWMLTPLLILLTSCSVTVSTLPDKKTQKPSTHGRSSLHSRQRHAVKQLSQDKPSGNIKETWWIENYHKLENARGNYTIPDDAQIKPLADGKFEVPDTVLRHYQDLLLAPSPTP